MKDKDVVSLTSSKRSKISKSTVSTAASTKASSKRSKSSKSTTSTTDSGKKKKKDKKKDKKKSKKTHKDHLKEDAETSDEDESPPIRTLRHSNSIHRTTQFSESISQKKTKISTRTGEMQQNERESRPFETLLHTMQSNPQVNIVQYSKSKKAKKKKSSKKKKKKEKDTGADTDQPRHHSIFSNPPPVVTEYLESLFRAAFRTYCQVNDDEAERLDLVEIRLCFRDSSNNQQHVVSTAQENILMSHLSNSQRKDSQKKSKLGSSKRSKKESSRSSSTKKDKKRSKKKREKYSETTSDDDSQDGIELPSSFFGKDLATITELANADEEETSGSSEGQHQDKRSHHHATGHGTTSVAHSSESGSAETPIVDNTCQVLASEQVLSNEASAQQDGRRDAYGFARFSPQGKPPNRANSYPGAPVSPRRQAMDLLEEEVKSILPPDRHSLLENEDIIIISQVKQDEIKKKKKAKKRSASKLNMVIKKALGKAVGSKKKEKNEIPQKKSRNKGKWSRLPRDEESPSQGALDEWVAEMSPRTRHATLSVKGWGVNEASESSEYGMSVLSDQVEGNTEHEERQDSSSADEESMYIEGEGNGKVQSFRPSEQTRDKQEYASSSEDDASVCDSDVDEESYYSEESWDEEEEYISPDEGDYVSPDEEGPLVLTNASDYVSPLDAPLNRGKVSFAEDQIAESMLRGDHVRNENSRLYPRIASQSAHSTTSYYEEIVIEDDDESVEEYSTDSSEGQF